MNRQMTPCPTGAAAPDFALQDADKLLFSLHGLRGRPVVLLFYPRDWDPVSREQLTLYQEYAGEFDRFDAQLLAISSDHMLSHEAFAAATRIQYPLLSDSHPRGEVARLYGVYREDRDRSSRALFVIDPHGLVRYSEVFPDQFNPGVDDVLTVLENVTGAR